MLRDFHTLDANPSIEAQICIIGAGAAGITLALELAGRGLSVVLLEGGGLDYEDDSQAIYEGELIGNQNTDLAYSRLRQFGGTTQHWTGMCAPLDPIDFEKRDGVAYSGWPITRTTLDPYYARAQPWLDLGPFAYAASDWKNEREGVPLPLDIKTVGNAAYRTSPPTRFTDKYQAQITASDRITALTHANLTDLHLNESGVITNAEIKGFGGQSARVRAGAYILATGGIENARLLLNFTARRPAGIGNERDLVGRYFIDHLNCSLSTFTPADPRIDISYYLDQDIDGVPVSMGLKLAEPIMRNNHLLNNTVFLDPVFAAKSHNDEFRDHAWLAFSAIAKAFSSGRIPGQLPARLCTIAEQPGAVLTGIQRHLWRQVEETGGIIRVDFRQDAEQSPNPQSRVFLNAGRDQFGMQRASLDWQVSNDDLRSLRRTHEIIATAIGAAGLGRIKLGIDEPPDKDSFFTGYHHLGTTRMHDNPRQGVVDRHCRVHETKNLYVAGSSVFTTGGTANPTLTIVALAIRLAEHLATLNPGVPA